MKISVVNLGICNLGSLIEAFRRIGVSCEIVEDASAVAQSTALVLPGVGSFGDGMAAIQRLGLAEAIKGHAQSGKKLLGICLGMQLLFEESEEHGKHQGLGIFAGRVVKLSKTSPAARIPNMGWCEVIPYASGSSLFAAEPQDFYFIHSFHCNCSNPDDVAATIDFGYPVTAAAQRGNLLGVQFHPEKSQDAGLALLERFATLP